MASCRPDGHRDPLPPDQVQRHRHLPRQERRAAGAPGQVEGQEGGGAGGGRRLLRRPRLRPRGEAVQGGGDQGDQGLAVRRAARELRPRPPRRRRQVRGRRRRDAREAHRLLPVQVLQAQLRRHLPLPDHPWPRTGTYS
jgi:hypothetical protein